MPEDELLEALRGLGADHEPDVAAIRRRIDGERTNVVPLRRRPDQLPRRRPVLLSAAAAILIGGGVTVAVSQLGPSESGTPAKDLPVLVPAVPTPSDSPTSPTPSPSRSDPEESRTKQPAPDGTSSAKGDEETESNQPRTPSTSSTKNGSANRPAGEQAASSTVSALANGQQIELGAANEDWLAIGTRNDMKTIRKKAASAAPLLNFVAPDSAASVDGPFQLSFSGGLPEQDNEGITRWMQTNGAVVTVTASPRARTVTLYTGNAMNIVVKGKGLEDHRVTLPDQAPGFVTTLQIPSHGGDTTIELQSGRGPVHLVAATATSG
ncbi:hypothetical protein [Kineosporia babensis]|uniref:Uncharacterized protein n=1 Tax=Kineosporia babensis TaxID=499548 RepID=A0A9X1N959_9ACTN|nr:hypothetical protein [Kineosporia babensis]MCD5309511.1 hypothetical protein [Kineosporia babensis]